MKINNFNDSLNKDNPEVGDYVIINDDVDYSDIDSNYQRDYLNSHVGKIYRIRRRKRNNEVIYDIEYKDAPVRIKELLSLDKDDNYSDVYLELSRDIYDIEYCSKDIKELELILISKKFNI